MPITHRLYQKLPMSKIKLEIARIIYPFVRIIKKKDKFVVKRRDIKYNIDLTEGIDLNLYLFGGFQQHIFDTKVKNDILDVGANAGHMALNFAKKFPSSTVYAFEPTDYAYDKLTKNLELNPTLSRRIVPINKYVSDSLAGQKKTVFAKWKTSRHSKDEDHPIHLGTPTSCDNADVTTLDEFVSNSKIKKVDLIKIDVDGNELEVLKGARSIITKHKPDIIFEVGLYLLEERNIDFKEYIDFLEDYTLVDLKLKKTIDKNNYMSVLPLKSTTDILAVKNG